MAALQIERLGETTHAVLGPTNLGLIDAGDDIAAGGSGGGKAGESAVVLVDSGNDEDAGRKVLRACEAGGKRIGMIVNTHSNADHCGGNAFIQARIGCRIAATRIEAAFIETPVLEPSYLWGGFPPPALRSKFLMAQASRVTDILEPPCVVPGIAEGGIAAAGEGLRALPLPGHFFGMVGIMTPDRVFFAADAVASAEILQKYHVFYLYDVAAHLSTLDMLESLEAEWFVPSHAAPVRDLRPTIKANRDKVFEIAGVIRGLCVEPESAEDLLAGLAGHYGMELNNSQHSLIGSTLRSMLSWLVAGKEMMSSIEGNRMRFRRA